MPKRTQGGEANFKGENCLDAVRLALLRDGGLTPGPKKAKAGLPALLEECRAGRKGLRQGSDDGYLWSDFPLCDSVYSRPFAVPYVAYRWDWKEPLAIAVRSQDIKGSVDEKLVYLLHTLILGSPIPFCLVLLGEWFIEDEGIRAWAARGLEQPRHEGRYRRVFVGEDDFKSWIHSGMKELPKVLCKA